MENIKENEAYLGQLIAKLHLDETQGHELSFNRYREIGDFAFQSSGKYPHDQSDDVVRALETAGMFYCDGKIINKTQIILDKLHEMDAPNDLVSKLTAKLNALKSNFG
ncbi:MAG: hypothetical protein ACXAD7_13815 [Candidatus Kariarchaeaceae archaeon]|jgi:hypothetical protein